MPKEVERRVDEILSAQPRHLLDQLELPPFYSQLPFNARWQIKDVLFDKQLNYRQKHETIFNVIMSLPPAQKRFPLKSSPLVPSVPLTAAADPSMSGGDGVDYRRREHSRLFDSYNALKYTIGFTVVSVYYHASGYKLIESAFPKIAKDWISHLNEW